MNDQAAFQQLTEAVGKRLWGLLPEGATEIIFKAAFHDNVEVAGVSHWLTSEGKREGYEGFDGPFEVEEAIKEDLRTMRTLDLFAAKPWNHVTVTLKDTGRVMMQYAYIDEVDHWSSLHMKGVSDLSQREANDEHGVPPADWLHIANEVLKLRTAEAEVARTQGNAPLLADLDAKIRDLWKRLKAAALHE